MTWAIAELLAEHAGRVTVSNPMRTRAIASAKVMTDKIDAKVRAQLGAADFLPEVCAPDEVTRALRRRIAHRSSLVRQRTRLRNQIHAVLARNLIDAPLTDAFGQGGRQWLAEVALTAHEREQVDSNLRLHDALDVEVELVELQLAEQALARPDVRRLMTIPGVGAITALALVAVIGDVNRFPQPAAPGRLSRPWTRACVNQARSQLVTGTSRVPGRRARVGCWSRRRTPRSAPPARCARFAPGSRPAAASRSRSAQPHASSRSSPHLLTKDEDYRYAAPTITQRKLRSLQRKSGDSGPRISLAGETKRKVLERRFLEEAERDYQNYVALKAGRRGAGVASGDTTVEAVKAANDARQAPQSPDACSSRSGSPAPEGILAPSP